jgi:uncharacterized delta-60 repeat protein
MSKPVYRLAHRVHPFTAVMLAAWFVFSVPLIRVLAAGGDLDPTFGTGGKVTTDFGNFEQANALIIQPDGKIVVVGVASPGNIDFALARYETDGSLDSSFGVAGKVVTDFGFDDNAVAVALGPNNKIAVTGVLFQGGPEADFGVALYNSDGSPDGAFGNNGKVITDFGGLDEANAVAVQADGKVVAIGQTVDLNTGLVSFAFARYDLNGNPDPTFGSNGKVITLVSGNSGGATAGAIQTDGKIVAAGAAFLPDTGTDFAVIRLNSNGGIDPTFGTGGTVTTDFMGSSRDSIRAMALQPDGKIIVGGFTNDSTNVAPALARYNARGSLDVLFGMGGKVVTEFGQYTIINALAIQPGGKIVVTVLPEFFDSSNDFALLRYNPNGRIDTGFGVGGKVTTNFFGIEDQSRAIGSQSDGKIILAGFTRTQAKAVDFALARYDGGDLTSFDICLEDNSNGNLLQFNSVTGDYQFTNCSGITLGGTGVVVRKGSSVTLQHNGPDRRILATFVGGANKGTASIKVLSSGARFTITDRNTSNNTCACATRPKRIGGSR